MLGVDGLTQERWRQAEGRESAAERRQRILAENLQNAEITVADDDGRDVSNLLAQLGRPLAAGEVMRRLKLCNPKLTFEPSKACPELLGIYITLRERTDAGTWVDKKIHICGMESGVMPEFSVLHKQRMKVPDNDIFGKAKPTRDIQWKYCDTFESETRGWRTVLIRLWHMGLINELNIRKHFGWTPSRDSAKWYERTR